jgi:hypothetical protein
MRAREVCGADGNDPVSLERAELFQGLSQLLGWFSHGCGALYRSCPFLGYSAYLFLGFRAMRILQFRPPCKSRRSRSGTWNGSARLASTRAFHTITFARES